MCVGNVLVRWVLPQVAIADAQGIEPLVAMLGSSSPHSQAHAAAALHHLSASVENKKEICKHHAIPKFVTLLEKGPAAARRHAAAALHQLAMTNDNRLAIVQASGIPALVGLLLREGEGVEATEAATAVLSELARSEKANRVAIVASGGIPPLARGLLDGSPLLQRYATCALWGLTQEPPYRAPVVEIEGVVEKLVNLLKGGSSGVSSGAGGASGAGGPLGGKQPGADATSGVGAAAPAASGGGVDRDGAGASAAEGTTDGGAAGGMATSRQGSAGGKKKEDTALIQGDACATLAALAQSEEGKAAISAIGGAGPLMSLALGPASWLRTQATEILKLLGHADPTVSQIMKGGGTRGGWTGGVASRTQEEHRIAHPSNSTSTHSTSTRHLVCVCVLSVRSWRHERQQVTRARATAPLAREDGLVPSRVVRE